MEKKQRAYHTTYTITMLMGLATGAFGIVSGVAAFLALLGMAVGTYAGAEDAAVVSMLLLLVLGMAECIACLYLFQSLKNADGRKAKKSKCLGLIMLILSAAYCAYTLLTGTLAVLPVAAIVLSATYLLVAQKVVRPVLAGRADE